jgi:hypothetical protein
MGKLRIRRVAIDQTLGFLTQSGNRNKEGIVLWLGRRTSSDSLASHVYQPIHTAASDFFYIPQQGMAHMLSFMGNNSVSVLAQVHTHPREAFHSQADDQWAIVRHLGALSLVLPNFARNVTAGTFMELAATFRLDIHNEWSLVPQNHLPDVLEVIE